MKIYKCFGFEIWRIKKMNSEIKLTTPISINRDVLEFCREINPEIEPCFVKVSPWEKSEYQDCFPNVERYTKSFGGELQQGWTIWEITYKFIEAEFHAVWVDGKGNFVDITKKPDREKQILFLPDSKREIKKEPIDNIRKVLRDTAKFRTMNILGEKRFKVNQKYWNGSKIEIPLSELKDLEKLGKEIFQSELQKDFLEGKVKIGRNEKCLCGSGLKYKRCCLSKQGNKNEN